MPWYIPYGNDISREDISMYHGHIQSMVSVGVSGIVCRMYPMRYPHGMSDGNRGTIHGMLHIHMGHFIGLAMTSSVIMISLWGIPHGISHHGACHGMPHGISYILPGMGYSMSTVGCTNCSVGSPLDVSWPMAYIHYGSYPVVHRTWYQVYDIPLNVPIPWISHGISRGTAVGCPIRRKIDLNHTPTPLRYVGKNTVVVHVYLVFLYLVASCSMLIVVFCI